MTINQILDRIQSGQRITTAQLQRLERRRIKLVTEMERLNSLLAKCYIPTTWGTKPDPEVVNEDVVRYGC